MNYPALDLIEISPDEYPDALRAVEITIRGKRNLFDIYFRVKDMQDAFGVQIPQEMEYTWLNTPIGRDKYLSYPSTKRFLFAIEDRNPLANAYMRWMDHMLFGNNRRLNFFKVISSDIDIKSEDAMSDTSDTDSATSFGCPSKILNEMNKEITWLEHQMQLKNKDIEILEREIQIRDKEIELLRIQLEHREYRSEWL